MEEDYVSLYEAVDEGIQVKSKIVAKDEYEKLTTIDRVQEDLAHYQLPHSNSSYVHHLSCSDNTTIISNEVQSMKKELRRIKILCLYGILITLILSTTFIITIAFLASKINGESPAYTNKTKQLDGSEMVVNTYNLSLIEHAGPLTKVDIAIKNLTKQVDYLKEAVNKLESPRNNTVFERCFDEIESCNFMSLDEGRWLSCKTNNIKMNREVSATFACTIVATNMIILYA